MRKNFKNLKEGNNMNKKIITLVCSIFIISIIVLPSHSFAATLYSGFDGVDQYETIGGCDFGDRYGIEYVRNLNNALGSKFYNLFSYEDKYAWEIDLTGSAANSVDFFAFAGHGVGATYLGNGNAAAHFFTQNSSSPPYHPSHQTDACNADWSEISWGGSDSDLKWVTMYSCHFLQNYGNQTYYNNLKHIFNGVHLVMGFASVMYLDPNEGTEYGNYISAGRSFEQAFFDAAEKWQKGHYDNTIARVMGAIKSQNDSYTSYSTDPDPWLQHPEEYDHWDRVINPT